VAVVQLHAFLTYTNNWSPLCLSMGFSPQSLLDRMLDELYSQSGYMAKVKFLPFFSTQSVASYYTDQGITLHLL